MNKIMVGGYEDNFLNIYSREKREFVLCGDEGTLYRLQPYLPPADFFWDVLGRGGGFGDIPSVSFEQLIEIKELMYILVCFNDSDLFESICDLLAHTQIQAGVFNVFHNCAFDFFRGNYEYVQRAPLNAPMKVRIVNYEGGGWILTKFAQRMNENLNDMGVRSEIGTLPDPAADINHHIPSHPYLPLADFGDTLMITHVDCQYKIDLLSHQLKTARMGICMSRETLDLLAGAGIPRNKLCYVNPAHDGNMKPKKYVIGITHRCYDYDLRKRENALLDIINGIDPAFFKFKIMGAGWQGVISAMRERGIEVEYYENFDYNLYHELIPSLDYYMFFGFDEGSMGYLDALAAGVKTIVTPQGFHLDVPEGIDHACCTVDQFTGVLYDLQYERQKRIASVADWTWENYVKKHIEIWQYITGRGSLGEIYRNQLNYEDGIFSCLLSNNII